MQRGAPVASSADGDRGVAVDLQPLADARVLAPAARRRERQGHGLGLGDVRAARADAVLDRLPGQVVGQDDRLREPDRVRGRGGRRCCPSPGARPGHRTHGGHQHAVPVRQRHLVVGRVGAVPHLDRVRLAEAELPGAADAGGVRMGRDDQAARPPDLAGRTGRSGGRGPGSASRRTCRGRCRGRPRGRCAW